MKSSVFWDITLRIPFKVNRRFGGTRRFHFQVRRISQARNQRGRWNSSIAISTEGYGAIIKLLTSVRKIFEWKLERGPVILTGVHRIFISHFKET
jgi:hypothetical protein